MTPSYTVALSHVQKGLSLSVSESRACVSDIFEGRWTVEETAVFLDALRKKGEAASEIVGFAETLRARMLVVPGIETGLDLCGTGGGPANRYNVSTAAAFVLASMGIGVAKHGNRGSKAPNGSFDFLESLELPIVTKPDQLSQLYRVYRLCFLYARAHHPIVGSVAEARKLAGGRTIFNLIGPLSNPGKIKKQVLGVSDRSLGPVLIEAATLLGQSDVLVVSGSMGYDEVTPFGETYLWNRGELMVFSPEASWCCTPDLLYISTREQAVHDTHLAFSGKDTPIARYIALNVGAALYCANHASSVTEGASLALSHLATGEVACFFDRYQKALFACL